MRTEYPVAPSRWTAPAVPSRRLLASHLMTLRSLSSAAQALTADEERRPPPALSGAVGIGVAAAVSLVLGAVLPVVAGATPGFAGMPLLIALAVVPIGVAAGFALTGRHGAAAGLLMALAVRMGMIPIKPR